MTTHPLLEVENLFVTYGNRKRSAVRAVHDISFSIQRVETVAVVGESGTGKSTLGGAVLGLVPVTAGAIRYDGQDIAHCSDQERRRLSSEIQAVFQNPYGSFNPFRRIRDSIVEPLLTRHPGGRRMSRAERESAVVDMLRRVRLDAHVADAFPRQLSGGQLQRVAIARALIASPRLVVLDEALSSLDLSVQAQIVNLLVELREDAGLAYLFIGHDLDVVKHLAHRVLVLHRGVVVESGPAVEVLDDPQHPYTRKLVASVPVPDPVLQRQRRAARAGSGEPAVAPRAS